jgi:adenylosuccinate lyase
MSLESSPAFTEATQWLERTLDDSANKRLALPQMFLGTEAAIRIAVNVTSGLVVYPAVIRRHIDEELPFIASENIMMEAVKRGGDRQELHEELRRLAQEAGRRVKMDGAQNELLSMVRESGKFDLGGIDPADIMDPANYIGRAPQQVDEFIAEEVNPVLLEEQEAEEVTVELNV